MKYKNSYFTSWGKKIILGLLIGGILCLYLLI